MHKLDDKTLITPLLIKRFHAEAEFEGGDGKYAAYIQKSDGHILIDTVSCSSGMLEQFFAEDMLNAMNKHLHHDGAWVIVFTHYDPPLPPLKEGVFNRFVLLWMDKDGDVKFPLECVHPLHKVMGESSIDSWLSQCEAAWSLWRHTETVLDARPSEQYRKAAGEVAPSVH
jgi:hypothetical protein